MLHTGSPFRDVVGNYLTVCICRSYIHLFSNCPWHSLFYDQIIFSHDVAYISHYWKRLTHRSKVDVATGMSCAENSRLSTKSRWLDVKRLSRITPVQIDYSCRCLSLLRLTTDVLGPANVCCIIYCLTIYLYWNPMPFQIDNIIY